MTDWDDAWCSLGVDGTDVGAIGSRAWGSWRIRSLTLLAVSGLSSSDNSVLSCSWLIAGNYYSLMEETAKRKWPPVLEFVICGKCAGCACAGLYSCASGL